MPVERRGETWRRRLLTDGSVIGRSVKTRRLKCLELIISLQAKCLIVDSGLSDPPRGFRPVHHPSLHPSVSGPDHGPKGRVGVTLSRRTPLSGWASRSQKRRHFTPTIPVSYSDSSTSRVVSRTPRHPSREVRGGGNHHYLVLASTLTQPLYIYSLR